MATSASTSATIVIENTTLVIVIVAPAIADRSWRAPSAPTPKKRGNRDSASSPTRESSSTAAIASAPETKTIIAGTNQRLFLRSVSSLAMGVPAICPYRASKHRPRSAE